ncbi:TonB-dependent receptor [Novosphingobium sp. BL-8A]
MFSLSRTSIWMLGTGIAAIVAPVAVEARTASIDVPAQPAASGIQSFARQAGVQVLVEKQLTRGKRTNAVKGNLDIDEALGRLLRGTGLEVISIDGTVITLGHRENTADTAPLHGSAIVVEAKRAQSRMTRKATAVVDTVRFDDVATLAGGDGSVVEQLVTLPGVTGIEEGDTPRFISIRGISADLNATTIDGLSIASIGSDGDGSRQVNLQLLPSNMSAGNEVYKSFTPELPGDAIGGVVNVATRSAFDHDGVYKVIDLNGIYSTYRGPAHINDITGSGAHWGQGVKGVISNRFGPGGQFGIVLSGEYQKRIRNSAKFWQGTKYYFSDAGKKLVGPEDPNWNGLIVPYDQQYASYTNTLRSYGGSAKLEWQSPDDSLYASIMGFGRRRYEDSTMNKQDYYTKSAVYDQTEDGGRQQINSIYTRYRHDNWNRGLFGVIGDLSWKAGQGVLEIRGGYNKALYDNHQYSIVARAYPKSAYLTYASNGGIANLPYITSLSDASVLDPTKTAYALSTAYDMFRVAREDMGNARVDYTWNADEDDRGMGFAVGAEWRNLILRRNLDETEYKTGMDMTNYLFTPDYTALGAIGPMPWISDTFVDKMADLTVDTANSTYDSLISDYRYNETTLTPYAALHYRTDKLALVWGVRFDHTRFTADTPYVSDGAIDGMTRNRGGYDFALPSLSAEYKLAKRSVVSGSISRTIGRPTPGDVAQARSVSCGETDDGGEGCTISQGNPDLKPRRATNLDFTFTQGFNGSKGLFGVSAFAKWIADDIYDLTSYTTVDDTTYKISQPLNASGSRIFGIEGRIENKGIRFAGQKFDLFANVTWMKGRMDVESDSGTRRIDRMLYQPEILANAGMTWHTPFLKSALTARYNYRGKYLETVGASPWLDEGRAGYGTLDLSLTQKVTSFATLKYEFYNVLGEKPKWLMGDKLQYYTEVDDYGRTAFIHLIIR